MKVQKKKKKMQMRFAGGGQTVCPECNMAYVKFVPTDQQTHMTFHKRALQGVEWTVKAYKTVGTCRINGSELKIVEVNPCSKNEVKVAEQMLQIANTELNAPEGCTKWKSMKRRQADKVFLAIAETRCVGVVSLEEVHTGMWLVHSSRKVVPNQKLDILVGISRVYVSKQWRRLGVGMQLLDAVRRYAIYGCVVEKRAIAWSQPSEFGGKLALKFNGVKHKSGSMLIPVYEED